MKSSELKKILEGYEKKALIGLFLELAKLQKDNMAWLETKLQGSEHLSESVEYYKKKILSSFEGRINLKVAKKAISDFRKASNDSESLIDLMLLYVEIGTEITIKYGDMYEQFYYSLECMYGDIVELLNKWGDKNLIEKFRPRLRAVVMKTEGMGWGYHDTLSGIYYDELGEEE